MATPLNRKPIQPETPSFKEWAKVELLGRNVMVGLVTEATLAGGAFLRVDVPPINKKPGYTRFINPTSIYAINPLSEESAMAILGHYTQAPIQAYELPQLPERVTQASEDLEADDNNNEDEP